MRTTAGSALAAILIAGALAAPVSAASLSGPPTVAPREIVAVTATGLAPGQPWGVYLTRPQASGLNCIARLARRTPASGGRPSSAGSCRRR